MSIALVLVTGCAANVPMEASSDAAVPSVIASTSVVPVPSVRPSLSVGTLTFCPGGTWPPYLLGRIPGVTATSRDRATIEITNRADRTYHYRVAGWHLDQFETCRALGEQVVEEGPIAPGTTVLVTIVAFKDRIDVPIIVAMWDKPCGEGCQRAAPIGALLVARSPLEPAAS